MEVARLYVTPEQHDELWTNSLYRQQYRRVVGHIGNDKWRYGFDDRWSKTEYITVLTIKPIKIFDFQTNAWITVEDHVDFVAEYNRAWYIQKG